MIKLINKNYFHFLFISLTFLNYFVSLILFGNITLFYHDVLDSGVVYNDVLGKFYKGETNSFNIFLNGNIKAYYMQYLLKPFSLIYGIFETELAYWITDILIKLTSYFSFFILSKKISKDYFILTLVSCIYAYFNANALNGFGTAFFPYLVYLCLFKNNLSFKHYFLIFFFGLNSDLVSSVFFSPLLIIFVYCFDRNIILEKKFFLLKIILLFYFSMALTSLNLFYILFSIDEFHRISFIQEKPNLISNLKSTIYGIFNFPESFKSWIFVKKTPEILIVIPIVILSLFSKNKIIRKILYIYFFYFLIGFIFNLKIFEGMGIGVYRLDWVKIYFPFIYTLLLLILMNKYRFKNLFIFFFFIPIFAFALSPSIVPFYKQNFLNKNKNYRNIYTFKGYYLANEFLDFKKLIKDERVISVGLDPMISVMNDINVIDGYHNLYPLKYKRDFRNIIKNELEKNEKMKKYYDSWGSRVYVFTNNLKNPDIDYGAIKKIGAKYLISRFELDKNKNLLRTCIECQTSLFLYKIL